MARIYAACLASYNNGVLHGRWVDLNGLDVDDVRKEIAEMLRESRYPNVFVPCPDCSAEGEELIDADCPGCGGRRTVSSAEEYAIHDYDELPSSFGEYPDLVELVEYAGMVVEHGDAWIAYVEHCHDIGTDPTDRHFEDCRAGDADSEQDWIDQFLDDTGVLNQVPENLRSYFDTEKYLRDMKMSGDVDFVEHEGTTYAFWRG
jgi:antirestriction protein